MTGNGHRIGVIVKENLKMSPVKFCVTYINTLSLYIGQSRYLYYFAQYIESPLFLIIARSQKTKSKVPLNHLRDDFQTLQGQAGVGVQEEFGGVCGLTHARQIFYQAPILSCLNILFHFSFVLCKNPVYRILVNIQIYTMKRKERAVLCMLMAIHWQELFK